MKNRLLTIIATIMISFLFNTTIFSQEDMVVVDNCDFKNPRRPPSVFKHDEHNDKAGIDECDKCHHVYENGNLVEGDSSEDQKCSECHSVKKSNPGLNLMKAYHKNCKGCHLETGNGPVMCGECHIK